MPHPERADRLVEVLAVRETSEVEIPESAPSVTTMSSTLMVEMPWVYASRTTV